MSLSLTPLYYNPDTAEYYVLNKRGSYEKITIGGGVTIYGPYASNQAALDAGRSVGDLYKSSEITPNGSPSILIVI